MNYEQYAYPIFRDVIPRLEYASKLADAEAVAEELEVVLKMLKPYSGNPAWWYPTLETDFDYIKSVMRKLVEDVRMVAQLPKDSYEYWQRMNSTRETIMLLAKNLRSAATCYYWPVILMGILITATIFVILVIVIHLL